jgi:hypothetical protein
LKKSTIEYRRGKQTRSPYDRKEKAKKAYRYPPWVTDPRNPEHPMPDSLVRDLQANILRVFPKLEQVPPGKRVPHWLWSWVPRQQAA